jgi:hypothetical protein
MNLNPPKLTSQLNRSNLTAAARLNNRQAAKRRSSRMALKACVQLSGEDRKKSFFTVSATATHLNKHGAAVQLNRDLVVGSVVSCEINAAKKLALAS